MPTDFGLAPRHEAIQRVTTESETQEPCNASTPGLFYSQSASLQKSWKQEETAASLQLVSEEEHRKLSKPS